MPDQNSNSPNPLSLISEGAGIVQGIIGAIQSKAANKRMNNLRAQRKAYQTPKEVYDALHATESRLNTGYDPATLNYLTGETDKAFNSAASTAKLLGADPNMLGEMFDQKVNQIMKIGAENHALNMENFNKYIGALGTVAENKAAEYTSQQNILKDDIQSAASEKQSASQNISNGINTFIGAASADKTSDLFTEFKKFLATTKGKKMLAADGGSTVDLGGYLSGAKNEIINPPTN